MNFKQGFAVIVFVLMIIAILNVAAPATTFSSWLKKVGLGEISIWQAIPLQTQTQITPGGTTVGTVNIPPGGVSVPAAYTYRLVDTTSSVDSPSGQIYYYNGRLERVYNDGRTEIVVGNFRNRFSGILIDANQMFEPYHFPEGSDLLYFTLRTYSASGASSRARVYRYDARGDTMKDLSVNNYLGTRAISSPYDKRVLLAIDDQTIRTYQRLYVVNLETDSARMVLQLSGNETLASSADESGNLSGANIYWVDDRVVEYSVYKRDTSQASGFTFVQNRRLTI